MCPPGAGSPGAGKDLVGPAAEQERVGALVDLVHERRGFVGEVRPSAALESAALVLLRPAGPLHHSVNGDLRGGRQLHGRGSFLVGSVVVRLMSKIAAVIAGLHRPWPDPRPGSRRSARRSEAGPTCPWRRAAPSPRRSETRSRSTSGSSRRRSP